MHVLTSSCSDERIQPVVHPLGRVEDTSVSGAHLESECRPRLLSPARSCSTSGMGLVLGGRRPVVLTGHADASWADDQATQWSSQGYTFSLGSGSVSWRSTRSSSVLSSSCEAEIYAGAMAAQELRWLTYLLTDLGEQPRSPPVLYVDNKAMLALCREHRLEHRTKHIALRYFLARELQQRGQLRLAYVASEANTADIFTKALAPGDHQRFCTLLACFALLDWSCDPLFSPTLPMGFLGRSRLTAESMAEFSGTHILFKKKPTRRPAFRVDADGWYSCIPPEPPEPPRPPAPPAPPSPPAPPAPPIPPAPPPSGPVSLQLTGNQPPDDCNWDKSAVGADDDVADAEEASGADHAEGSTEASAGGGAQGGTAEDVFPEGVKGNDDYDGIEHKLTDHKRQGYTAAEKLKWVALMDVAVSVRALARESGIHRKCLTNWKRVAEFLKDVHSARKRMHGRGRASWYRTMELKV
ncbi:unnamed protein product [Closterium sp. NIES-53]